MPLKLHPGRILLGFSLVAIPAALLYHYVIRKKSVNLLKGSESDDEESDEVAGSVSNSTNGSLSYTKAGLTSFKNLDSSQTSVKKREVTILYGTVTGTSRSFAITVREEILINFTNFHVNLHNLKDYDEETKLPKADIVILISCTWTEGTAPEHAQRFFTFLDDFAHDFRVSKDHLANISFMAFGLGSAYYGNNYGKCILDGHENLCLLGATPLLPARRGDDQTDVSEAFDTWKDEVLSILAQNDGIRREISPNGDNKKIITNKGVKRFKIKPNKTKVSLERTIRGNSFQRQQLEAHGKITNKVKKAPGTRKLWGAEDMSETSSVYTKTTIGTVDDASTIADDEERDELEEEDRINDIYVQLDKEKNINPNLLPPVDDEDEDDSDDEDDKGIDGDNEKDFHQQEQDGTLDMEDLGSSILQSKKEALYDSTANSTREMVTKIQRKSLTKEGYRIIGTHSAVKLCRWTKNQMRGRGGCYKHTFYGITSYQCMEATPSLACANKCVFCWRHHKNPVGTEWRWKQDHPGYIVEEAVELHKAMINEMRGVPGVKPERLEEGFNVRHCALSLVGEPIMYPRINAMLQELHQRGISSFMVTNAQFPAEIRNLDPCTQLYVSIDAATKDTLKAIDRPLFSNFWERFQGSLEALAAKQQRTVYRLTLVNEWNMKEVDEYAQLIINGTPDFIEIKAVTFCGKSDASTLTIGNSPWHK